jgi:short subunit dehydrogenase-like uncharacterized protein
MGMMATPTMRWLLKQVINHQPAGPSLEMRQKARSRLWGEARDAQGHQAVCRMEAPDGYALTVETALAIVKRVLSGDVKPGFQTPASAYGADFILEFEGVLREDIELDSK